MAHIVKRSYKYRFYPTSRQAEELTRTFGCVRLVYNRALEERTRAYRQEGRKSSYAQTSAALTQWKRTEELRFLNEVSCVPLQQTLRHLQAAFTHFYAKRADYPVFKSRKRSRASAEYTRSAFRWRDGTLTLAKMHAPLDIVWSRPLPDGAEPSTVTVSRDAAGRWFVSILIEEKISPLAPTGAMVGVDLGITTLATLSTGEKIANPRHERTDHRKLAKAQRALARKAAGSANRAKARLVVARIKARITDRRRDHLHKVTTRLVHENQVIALEDLAIRNMVKNRSLARAISDAGWRELRSMLEYKAAWYGRHVLVVDRWFPSSKRCSVCGSLTTTMALGVRNWVCGCGAVHDRDVNAAINILAAGLAERRNACGAGVRPQGEPLSGRRPAMKQEPLGRPRELPCLPYRENAKPA
ncbi:IS200/IS605 family element transposase accessory protein TnpB [Herbidospora sp. NEAU-GS84]|uniref:IS200/IS605 family element transposase accessory protein TnpB n=1 Tax=Herbidospora solisilvae TaxID=2696284 RepID=A0A7C9JI81_9ACTN|nr:RNA-guided endonuclease TnpB family protein [Herbidospora solisilvae]NAS27281.1 IS200/IS605 family element transposase accessory protein TnpB [Herbidospora solisilvae]